MAVPPAMARRWNPRGYLVGDGERLLQPEVGVTGTPVIDPSTNTLYVSAQSVNLSGPIFYQRLHAIDLFTGKEKFGGPANIWNSSMIDADAGGNAVKFTVPTVANGKVYVETRDNNSGGVFGSTSVSGELDVYGLKQN